MAYQFCGVLWHVRKRVGSRPSAIRFLKFSMLRCGKPTINHVEDLPKWVIFDDVHTKYVGGHAKTSIEMSKSDTIIFQLSAYKEAI